MPDDDDDDDVIVESGVGGGRWLEGGVAKAACVEPVSWCGGGGHFQGFYRKKDAHNSHATSPARAHETVPCPRLTHLASRSHRANTRRRHAHTPFLDHRGAHARLGTNEAEGQ